MDMNDDYGPDNFIKPSDVTVKDTSSWKDWLTGHHSATYTTSVPPGQNPAIFSEKIAKSIGSKPAPLSPTIVPTETPQLTNTIGQPSMVSLATSQDKSENNVNVEAMPDHILGGKKGTGAGINYSVSPGVDKQGTSIVTTTKESYGDSKWKILNPLRHFVGSKVLDPHIENQIQRVLDESSETEDVD